MYVGTPYPINNPPVHCPIFKHLIFNYYYLLLTVTLTQTYSSLFPF
jgi:hypothetical protein